VPGYGLTMFRGVGAFLVIALAFALNGVPAQAATGAQFGIQDDAWLMYGPGTLSQRLTTLDNLGVGIVRLTLRFDRVAPKKPASPRDPDDYDWGVFGETLDALHAKRMPVLITLYGSPRWANGGHTAATLPTSGFGNFA
jgi:hypothetical protein